MWTSVPRENQAEWKHADGDNIQLQPQVDQRLLGDDEANNDRGFNNLSGPPPPHSPRDHKQDGIFTEDQQPVHGTNILQAQGAAERKPNLLTRVGKHALLVSVISILGIFVAVGFLAWLWYGNRSEERWRRLTLGGWSNQAVTISGLVLRTGSSVLAGVSTSMIASIALEKKGVPLWDALRLSVARFTSPSPDTFWHETLFRRYFIDVPLRVLLLGLILSTLAVQFSSTILLSDVGLGRVIGFPGSSTNRTGFAWSNANYLPRSDTGIFSWSGDFVGHNVPFQSLQDYWTGQPSASHTFAEYSEPGITHEEIDDTGLTLRSFLPISDQNIRNNLRNFSGLAPVFDTRVVCVRPELIEASLTADIYNMTLSLRSLGATIPAFTATRGDILAELPRVDSRGSHGWVIYPLNASVGGMLSPLDASSRQDISLTYTDYPADQAPSRFMGKVQPPGAWRSSDEQACGVDLGNAYIVMDTRGPYGVVDITGPYAAQGKAPADIDGNPIQSGPGRGPWLPLFVDRNTDDSLPEDWYWLMGEVTVCFDSLPKGAQYHHIQDFEITASGTGERLEPLITFRSQEETSDIVALRGQLGAGNPGEDAQNRSILQLGSIDSIRDVVDQSSEQWQEYCSSASEMEANGFWDANIYNRSTYSWVKEMALGVKQPIALCTGNCRILGQDSDTIRSSRGMAWIVDETIRGTGSPALAMRAVLTQALREAYYAWFFTLDHESELETVVLEAVQIPLRYRGLWIVFGITLVHLFLCLITYVAFAMLTETSCLNNGWQAVAEVINHEDGRRIVEAAGHMRDTEVERWIETDRSLRRRFTVRRGGV